MLILLAVGTNVMRVWIAGFFVLVCVKKTALLMPFENPNAIQLN
jgi:hypothetical protein